MSRQFFEGTKEGITRALITAESNAQCKGIVNSPNNKAAQKRRCCLRLPVIESPCFLQRSQGISVHSQDRFFCCCCVCAQGSSIKQEQRFLAELATSTANCTAISSFVISLLVAHIWTAWAWAGKKISVPRTAASFCFSSDVRVNPLPASPWGHAAWVC